MADSVARPPRAFAPSLVKLPPTNSRSPTRSTVWTVPLVAGNVNPADGAPVARSSRTRPLRRTPARVLKSPPTYTVPSRGPAASACTAPSSAGAKSARTAPVTASKATTRERGEDRALRGADLGEGAADDHRVADLRDGEHGAVEHLRGAGGRHGAHDGVVGRAGPLGAGGQARREERAERHEADGRAEAGGAAGHGTPGRDASVLGADHPDVTHSLRRDPARHHEIGRSHPFASRRVAPVPREAKGAAATTAGRSP